MGASWDLLSRCRVSASCLRVDSSHCSTKPVVTKHGHLRTSVSLCGLVWAQACSLRALVLQVTCSEDGLAFFSCWRKCGCFTERQVASCPGSRCYLAEQNLRVSLYKFHVLSVRMWPRLLVSPYLEILRSCGPAQPFLLVDEEVAFADAETPASGCCVPVLTCGPGTWLVKRGHLVDFPGFVKTAF